MKEYAHRATGQVNSVSMRDSVQVRRSSAQREESSQVLQLQRVAGNRAVQRLLQSDAVIHRQAAPVAPAPPAFQIVHGSDFQETADGVTLDATLLANVNALCSYLIEQSLVTGNIIFNDGVRSPSRAHRWSTAYGIREGHVPDANVQALENGQDSDGNVWYQTGWTHAQIVANAQAIWNGSKAAEGYPVGSAKRLPNTDWIQVSRHCTGNAMDVAIPWVGNAWSAQAKQIIADHGLRRPEPTESWHFELA